MPTTTYRLALPKEPKEIVPGHLRQGGSSPQGDVLGANSYYLTLNDQPFFGVSGEYQFSRYPCEFWEEELRKIKATGVNILATYLFWVHHEPQPGQFQWQGQYNVRHFVQLCQKVGLYVAARIGPFAHGECRNGGLPDWLYGQPFEVRSNHPDYLAYVERYYRQVGAQLGGLWFAQGGPIIALQLDNEYMHTGAPWDAADRSQGVEWITAGREGVSYLLKLRELARQAGMEAPYLTFTAWGSPIIPEESLPMYGGYAYPVWVAEPFPSNLFLFQDLHAMPAGSREMTHPPFTYPVINAEMQGGIQVRYTNRPVVPPRSTEALALVKIAGGSNYLGYYIYHGGSNPQVNGFFTNEINHPQVSYDFQAPIGEYGEVRPAARYLKLLHLFLQAFGQLLAPMGVALPDGADEIQPADCTPLRYCARAKGESGFLFLNNFQDHVELPAQQDFRLELDVNGQTLAIPAQGSLTLPAGTCCIWPFNLDLAGVCLCYATAQPLTVLQSPGGTHYFFFAVEGISAEYAFDSQALSGLRVGAAETKQVETGLVLQMEPGLESAFSFTAPAGQVVRLTTLTRQQAECAWRGFAWGQERLIVGPQDLSFGDGGVELRLLGEAQLEMMIYPPVESLPRPQGASVEVTSAEAGSLLRLSVLPREPGFHLVQHTENKFHLTFDAGFLHGLNDVYLHIEYEGDTCGAYIAGQLVADHYNNGTPWQIGLKRFAPQLIQHGLLLVFRPLHRGTVKNISSPMASRAVFEGEQLLKVEAVKLLPEYKIWL
jgi:beta-galactosidase